MKTTPSSWGKELAQATTEEDVKAAYAKVFHLRYNTANRHDLYTPQALFEFKYDKNLKNLHGRARVLAQLLYYIRELRHGSVTKRIPPYLVLADRNECSITETSQWFDYIKTDNYDWDLSPSTPDTYLVDDLTHEPKLAEMRVYDLSSSSQQHIVYDEIHEILSGAQKLVTIKKVITEDNFTDVFDYWKELFGPSVENGVKASTYFIQDIQVGMSHLIANQGKVIFELEHGEAKTKKIIKEDYEHFWSLYEKVTDVSTIQAIIAKIDRINDMDTRRFEGEFYTPLPFAQKGIEYLEKTIGKDWHKKKIRIWDMAAGTGNLEWYLPNEMAMELYVSTLHTEEVDHCRKLFLGATCFQYDYLNDDVERLLSPDVALLPGDWKLPEKLRQELADPSIEWIVLINPPFGTAQTAGANSDSKKNVSATALQKYMHADGLGEVSRELFQQFLYRIYKEMPLERTHLGLFSKLKFINSTNDRMFRDTAFRYVFQRGFIFEAKNFHGTKGKFPVGFTVWDMGRSEHLESQRIVLDIFDRTVHKIGQKTVMSVPKDRFLSTWVPRPRNMAVFPAFKSAINIAHANKDIRDRICEGFLGSLDNAGNDVQNSNRVGLYSGPFATAGAHSITAENFEKSLVVHAVRRIVPNTWINDRDQFMQPNKELSAEFVSDCVVWSLFANSNQTSALRDVIYKGTTYQVENNFFPFTTEQVRSWKPSDNDIALGALHASDRFVALWLQRQRLSAEASTLMHSAAVVYRLYFAHLSDLRTPKYSIASWDAGWWQIRNTLRDQNLASEELAQLAFARKVLQHKLLKAIYEYGFISAEIDSDEDADAGN